MLLLSIPNHLADGFVVHIDPRLVAATIAFSLIAALLAGVAPAVQVARMQRVSEFGRSITGNTSKQRLRSILVITEIALAFVLLRWNRNVSNQPAPVTDRRSGIRSDSVLTGSVALTGTEYRDNKVKQAAFIRDVLSRVSDQPGVVAAAATSFVPFSGGAGSSGSFTISQSYQPKF